MSKNPAKQEVILSASTIKSIEDCSWLYYAKKILKFPDPGNAGSSRGSTCHLVFEMLMNPRHRHHFDLMMKRGGLEASPALVRLVKKHLTNYGINAPEHYELMKEMIWVGLNNDFYGPKDAKFEEPEKEFLLEGKGYRVRGFIDKCYEKDGKAQILDYKSSKGKFSGSELENNIQAYTYTLAAKKLLWPGVKDVSVKFLFLRFPQNPIQEVKVTDEQLKGFEKYLAYLYKIVNNFDEQQARRNFAYDSDKKKWLCKAGKWECPARMPKDFFTLMDGEKFIKSSFDKAALDKIAKPGQTIEVRHYKGCPKFNINV